MATELFGAIYIGSYEVSLKIFEFSSRKKIREIDHVRARLDLGMDVYKIGRVGYEIVDELCDILSEFAEIMRGYKVADQRIYASAILREADNSLFVADQIYLRTGFEVNVISNSENRFIGYKSVAGRERFEKMIQGSAAVVDIGGSAIQITLFRKGKLITTRHMEIGTVRLRELLSNYGHTLGRYERQMEEYVSKKLEVFCSMYLSEKVEDIIFLNDYCYELVCTMEKNHSQDNIVKAERLIKYIEKLQKESVEEISEELGLSSDKDALIVPSITMFKVVTLKLGATQVWVPGVNMNDGIAYDYAQEKRLLKVSHDFDADILSAAQYLSEHFNSYSPHIETLKKLSTKIFDTMKKVHGMGERERLLLQVAVMLHDCGKYVSLSNSPRCSYEIIMSSEIIGLKDIERQMVAYIVLYNTLLLEPYEALKEHLDKDNYLIVAKLSAILRVANALDQSHRQKFQDIHIALKGRELVITVESLEDISLEQALFESKTSYFERVFSMKPILKEKRVYNYKSKEQCLE